MKKINVNVSDKEYKILKAYSDQEERNYGDIIREFIRSLEQKLTNGSEG